MTVHVWDGGSNTSPYDTWAKAATTLATGCAYGTYTDDVWMAKDHAEDPAGLVTFTSGGTYLTGSRYLYSVDRATDLPAAADNPQINNSTGDIYFNGDWVIENCWFRTQAGNIRANSTTAMTRMYDCIVDITGIGYAFDFLSGSGFIHMEGGSVNHLTSSGTIDRFIDLSGSNVYCTFHGVTFTAATQVNDFLFKNQAYGIGAFVGCDLSGVTADNLVSTSGYTYDQNIDFLDCELPASLSEYHDWGLVGNAVQSDMAKVHNCTAGQNRFNDVHDANGMGEVITERSIYRDDGFGFSLKISSAGNNYLQPVDMFIPVKAISFPIPANASSIDIEIARDGSSTPFTDHDVWPCVSRPKSSNNAHIWDRGGAASVLEGPTNWPSSDETWTGLSGTSVKQTMSVDLTGTSKDGRGHVWVFFAVPDDAIYVDQKPIVN